MGVKVSWQGFCSWLGYIVLYCYPSPQLLFGCWQKEAHLAQTCPAGVSAEVMGVSGLQAFFHLLEEIFDLTLDLP